MRPRPAARDALRLPFQRPVGQAIQLATVRPDDLQTASGFAGLQSGPPDKIPDRRRPMAPEVPPSQLRERLLPFQLRRGRGPLGQEGIGELLTPAWPAADQ